MDSGTIAEVLGTWEGYSFGTVGRKEFDGREQVWIELLPRREAERICSGCGKRCSSIHDTEERWVKDLPILECETHLLVHRNFHFGLFCKFHAAHCLGVFIREWLLA